MSLYVNLFHVSMASAGASKRPEEHAKCTAALHEQQCCILCSPMQKTVSCVPKHLPCPQKHRWWVWCALSSGLLRCWSVGLAMTGFVLKSSTGIHRGTLMGAPTTVFMGTLLGRNPKGVTTPCPQKMGMVMPTVCSIHLHAMTAVDCILQTVMYKQRAFAYAG